MKHLTAVESTSSATAVCKAQGRARLGAYSSARALAIFTSSSFLPIKNMAYSKGNRSAKSRTCTFDIRILLAHTLSSRPAVVGTVVPSPQVTPLQAVLHSKRIYHLCLVFDASILSMALSSLTQAQARVHPVDLMVHSVALVRLHTSRSISLSLTSMHQHHRPVVNLLQHLLCLQHPLRMQAVSRHRSRRTWALAAQ